VDVLLEPMVGAPLLGALLEPMVGAPLVGALLEPMVGAPLVGALFGPKRSMKVPDKVSAADNPPLRRSNSGSGYTKSGK